MKQVALTGEKSSHRGVARSGRQDLISFRGHEERRLGVEVRPRLARRSLRTTKESRADTSGSHSVTASTASDGLPSHPSRLKDVRALVERRHVFGLYLNCVRGIYILEYPTSFVATIQTSKGRNT